MAQENLESRTYEGMLTKELVVDAIKQGKEGTYKHPVIELLNDKSKLFEEYSNRFREKEKTTDYPLGAQDEEGLFDTTNFIDSIEHLPDFNLGPLEIIAIDAKLYEICPGYYTLGNVRGLITWKFVSSRNENSKSEFKNFATHVRCKTDGYKTYELPQIIQQDEEALQHVLSRLEKIKSAYYEVIDFKYNAKDAGIRLFSGEKLEKYYEDKATELIGDNWSKSSCLSGIFVQKIEKTKYGGKIK